MKGLFNLKVFPWRFNTIMKLNITKLVQYNCVNVIRICLVLKCNSTFELSTGILLFNAGQLHERISHKCIYSFRFCNFFYFYSDIEYHGDSCKICI